MFHQREARRINKDTEAITNLRVVFGGQTMKVAFGKLRVRYFPMGEIRLDTVRRRIRRSAGINFDGFTGKTKSTLECLLRSFGFGKYDSVQRY